MISPFRKQLWVAFKIWMLAVAINTLFGSILLIGIYSDAGLLPLLLIWGSIMGLIFSFPVFVLLLIIINRCVASYVRGSWICRVAFISGVLLTLLTWRVFTWINHDLEGHEKSLLVVALMAAVLSVGMEFRSLYKLEREVADEEPFSGPIE